MRFFSSRLFLFVAASLVGLAVACRPNETLEAQNRDAELKASIKTELASEVGAATLTSVEVNVTRGVVTLAGPVHSAAEKQQIESVVRKVKGVASVNNDLQVLGPQPVEPPATTASDPGRNRAAGLVTA